MVRRHLISLFLASALCGVARPTAGSPPIEPATFHWKGESRIIKFHSKVPVGTLRVLMLKATDGSPLPEPSLGPAVGAVSVPKDREVSLVVSYDGSLYLAWLDSLGPNDLQGLEFITTGLTDDGLQHIEHLSGLKRLDLRDNELTDKALEHMAPLKKLESVALDRLGITDEGLKILSNFQSLKYLSLSHNNLDGSGLKYLKNLKNLHCIDISSTPMNGQPLKYLDQQELSDLNAMSSKVSDADCAIFRNLKLTGTLSLSKCAISNAGLRNLGTLPRLRQLWVMGTQIDAKGVQAFKRTNPRCQVIWDPNADAEHTKMMKRLSDEIK